LKRKFSRILGVGLVVMLLFSLLTIPALATISGVTLAVTPVTISSAATYTITFNAGAPVAAGGTITVTFPTGVNIAGVTNAVDADVTVASTAGIGGAGSAGAAQPSGSTVVGQVLTITTVTAFGSGSLVQVKVLTNIFNPGTIGTYSLTVATSAETTAVATPSFTTTAPTILPLPGVVERYNSVGVLMQQTNVIQTAIGAASAGDSIMVGPGTYDEDLTIAVSVTLQGNAATTIIKDTNADSTGGMVTITLVGTATTGVVLDGFTISGDIGGANALTITGSKVTVRNCIFTKAGIATTAVAQTLVSYAPAALPALASTITNCVFDTTLGTLVDTGIAIAAGANAIGLTVSNSTFTVDGAIGLEDSAINTSGVGTALLPIVISSNNITGASGIGVTVTAGVATVSDNTLTGLNQAINVVAGTATITGNSIDACGLVVSTTAPVGKAAINVTLATALSITNNSITNSPNDIIQIIDSSENINMMFNNLSDNAIGIDNDDADTTKTLNATHNWWGMTTGPATGFNLTAGAVNNTTGYLGGEATGNFTNTVGALSLLTRTTVGVDVIPNSALVAGGIIGVANYSANPQDATPLPALAGGFYDVYVTEPAAVYTSILIKFYNANITANTTIYVWGTIAGGWVPVTGTTGVNLYEGYAFTTVTTTTTPSITGLAGTPFALCEAPVAALAAPTSMIPTSGTTDASLTPTFSWAAVTGAAGYYFELADNTNFVAPLVKLDGDFGRLVVTAYHYAPGLDYSSAYYWRVKSVSGTVDAGTLAESAWLSGIFVTMDEAEEPAPPIVITETPAPEIIIEQTPAPIIQPVVEVITPPATPITPAWIYVIIGVGAVLVISLLVLIVRTRRVA